jgi:hypothetical protein
MERRNSKSDRSAKLLQSIQQEEIETFTGILSTATPDEVLFSSLFPYVCVFYSSEKLCRLNTIIVLQLTRKFSV